MLNLARLIFGIFGNFRSRAQFWRCWSSLVRPSKAYCATEWFHYHYWQRAPKWVTSIWWVAFHLARDSNCATFWCQPHIMEVCNELSASQANLVPTTVLQYSALSLLVLLTSKSLMLQCDELPNSRFIVIHTFQAAVDQDTLHYGSSCTLEYCTTCDRSHISHWSSRLHPLRAPRSPHCGHPI